MTKQAHKRKGGGMDIKLNTLFHLSAEEIGKSKIELNMNAGKGGEAFLDRWLRRSVQEKENGYGDNWDCSYWGWYSTRKRNFLPGQWVFSFVRIDRDEWLFISAAEILQVSTGGWAQVRILQRFAPFFGKLVLQCRKGNALGRYVFNLSKYIEQARVKEILSCLYSGEKFRGYDQVLLPYKKLEEIFNGQIMPSYSEALAQISGVYCLTDTNNGKLYIGSAYGEGGVRKRWGDYFSHKEGVNKKLKELHKEKGRAYFEKYFTFTILEFFGKHCDKNIIIQREEHWKRCLNTIANGYNCQ